MIFGLARLKTLRGKKSKITSPNVSDEDCGPKHPIDWDTDGSGFFEIHNEYVADWDQPLRFYLMYHRNGTFKWVPGGAVRNFPEIVKAHEDSLDRYDNDGDEDEDEE
jgi:hypothetical protein